MFVQNLKFFFLSLAMVTLCQSTQGQAAQVTFRLNMNGVSGFDTPEVNGTFNGWCGTCNAMSDSNGDGIWETTISLAQGYHEYKYSFDNWTGQENLRDADCSSEAENRTLLVTGDVVLDVVCWGLCEDCLPADESNWDLVWAEEFLGNSLNMDTWNFDLGATGWGNNEWQNYTDSPLNHQVGAGSLKIIARHLGGENYSSARITTQGKFEFQYGKAEARIKVPLGQGVWPAFWMLGSNFPTIGWPQCGEIDIMEHVNEEHVTHAAAHWNLDGHTYETTNVPFEINEFHRYGIIWDEGGVTYTLNDHPFFYFPFMEENNTAQIFQNPFYFLLNVAVGGNWPGYPDSSTPFPAVMEVQYIRVYEKSTLGSTVESPKESVKAWPNPTDDHVYLDFEKTGIARRVHAFNSSGQKMASFIANDDRKLIDMHGWASGLYILQVWEGKEQSAVIKVLRR